jgi:Tat protein translocase TatB subunit
MFNIGFSEMLLLGVIALVFIGPNQLPEVARNIAKFINELKRNTENLRENFKDSFTESIPQKPTTSQNEQKEFAHKDSPTDPLNQEKRHENV